MLNRTHSQNTPSGHRKKPVIMITLFKKAKTRIQHRSDANKITEKRKKTTSWCKKRKRIGSKKYIWVQRDLKVLSFNLLLCSVWFQLIVSSVQQTFVIESLCRSRHRLSFFPFVFCVRYKLRCHFRVRRSECMGETSGASSTHILEKQMKRIIKLYFFISLARIYMRNAISHIWQRTTHTRLHHTWLLPQKRIIIVVHRYENVGWEKGMMAMSTKKMIPEKGSRKKVHSLKKEHVLRKHCLHKQSYRIQILQWAFWVKKSWYVFGVQRVESNEIMSRGRWVWEKKFMKVQLLK